MSALAQALKAHFKEHDIHFEEVEGEPTHLLFGFAGDHAEYRCVIRTYSESGLVICYSVCPLSAPEAKHDAIARFLTLANYGMQFGNFEMDFGDGEIRYKTSLWLGETPLTEEMIQPMIGVNFTAIDRYMPGIVAVIASEISPEQAIKQVEGAPTAEQAS